MKKCSRILHTSDQQFAFKANHSTTLCSGMLIESVNTFVKGNSCVYSCFLDASKAVDKVHYGRLFRLLLDRGMPRVYVRFIIDGYSRQSVCIQWESTKSRNFHTCNGVKQGGVISPILFAIYYDELKELGTSRTRSAVIRCLTICQHIPVVRKNHKNQLTQQFDIICCLARGLALCIESKQIMSLLSCEPATLKRGPQLCGQRCGPYLRH